MQYKIKKFFIFLLVILFLITLFFVIKINSSSLLEDNIIYEQESEDEEKNEIEPLSETKPLPKEVLYDVPFTAQAPFGNWDDIRQDTGCEEASVLMAMKWVSGEDLTPEEAEQEIIAISEFEKENYGHHHDTSTKDTLKLIKEYYNYDKAYTEYDIEIEDIKKVLAQGSLVIVPINGQIIGNPYYTFPGPFQHKIVIRGYNDETQEFITNDPGTRRGNGYRYNYQVLKNALMDYPTGFKEPIDEITTSMIIVMK